MNVYKRIALILMTGATLLLITSLLSAAQASQKKESRGDQPRPLRESIHRDNIF